MASLSSSTAVKINSNVKQESKAFQKDKINSFNTSTYGKLRTNETKTEIRFNIVVLAALAQQTDGCVIMSQTWSPIAAMIMTVRGPDRTLSQHQHNDAT